MSNFTITFEYPWLLLLIIPAVGLTLFTYFRLAKKYRRTRNRIISIILHVVIMVLCIFTLSGIGFSYELDNKNNEVLLLVDMSFSGQDQEIRDARNSFVKSVIKQSDGTFKVGVVTFGFDQVYAVKLTDKTDTIYNQYLEAQLPDTSATDIASALLYAKSLFSNPESAKIVLISDGLETDKTAMDIIKSVSAEGIQVDTSYFGEAQDDPEIQVVNLETPDYNVSVGDVFSFALTVQSSFSGSIAINITDNGEKNESYSEVTADIVTGEQNITLDFAFSVPGLHEIGIEITSSEDTLAVNNGYFTYMYLEVFDQILIIESITGESDPVKEMLEINYNVDVVNVSSVDLPSTTEELREYDQVILVNIANSDFPDGFIEILNSYVYDYGGGLFTFGGNEETDDTQAHAYNREDMFGSTFQQMLPVQVVDYTPPIALVIIIDCSGSMGTGGRLDLAKEGANACVNSLSSRDYCGVVTLATDTTESIALTATTTSGKRKLLSAISGLSSNGGTNFAPAITLAGRALKSTTNVEKKHIMIISDGMAGDPLEHYKAAIADCYENGITVSIIVTDTSSESVISNMTDAVSAGGGNFYNVTIDDIQRTMMEDLKDTIIDEVSETAFTPTIKTFNATVNGITQSDLDNAPQILGFYGTNAKIGATTVLTGEYVPIYSQWNYGSGRVGSFLTSVAWSELFLQSMTGSLFFHNVITGLFPIESIRAQDIDAVVVEDNYNTQLSIYTDLESDQTIEVTVTSPATDGQGSAVQTLVGTIDNYSRFNFIITTPGVHTILIEKKDANGEVLSSCVTYRSFSYSEEYDQFKDQQDGLQLLIELAEKGKGALLTDGVDVLNGMVKTLQRSYDPRLPFMIAAIVLFLLDVAVRKFKFKWIHEIVRESKVKKAMKQN